MIKDVAIETIENETKKQNKTKQQKKNYEFPGILLDALGAS